MVKQLKMFNRLLMFACPIQYKSQYFIMKIQPFANLSDSFIEMTLNAKQNICTNEIDFFVFYNANTNTKKKRYGRFYDGKLADHSSSL